MLATISSSYYNQLGNLGGESETVSSQVITKSHVWIRSVRADGSALLPTETPNSLRQEMWKVCAPQTPSSFWMIWCDGGPGQDIFPLIPHFREVMDLYVVSQFLSCVLFLRCQSVVFDHYKELQHCGDGEALDVIHTLYLSLSRMLTNWYDAVFFLKDYILSFGLIIISSLWVIKRNITKKEM